MRVVLVLLALLAVPFASGLYADLSFEVGVDGSVEVEGVTNVPSLEPGVYTGFTSKTGSRWLVNITTSEVVETFVYVVRLPEGAQINYVAGRDARITIENGHVAVRGSGNDAPLSVVVQYTIEPSSEGSPSWLFAVLGVFAAITVFALTRKQRSRRRTAQPKPISTPSYLYGIPERQQAMVKLLRGAGGTLTQRQLELTLKLPKSSISRNVEALRRRGVVEKAQLGMTNTVVLAEQYR